MSRRPDEFSTPSSAAEKTGDGLDALDELEEALAAAGDEELRVKAHDFSVAGDGEYSCTSEAVLLGHDTWVTGLNWAPRLSHSTPAPLQLLSASADRSMILWEPLASGSVLPVNPSLGSHATTSTASATVWTSLRRFGEFTSSTNLGFFGALWGYDGKTVLANGWGGSWHVWKLEGAEGMEDWVPQVAVSGHLGTVKQVVWEGEGEYLLSARCVTSSPAAATAADASLPTAATICRLGYTLLGDDKRTGRRSRRGTVRRGRLARTISTTHETLEQNSVDRRSTATLSLPSPSPPPPSACSSSAVPTRRSYAYSMRHDFGCERSRR